MSNANVSLSVPSGWSGLDPDQLPPEYRVEGVDRVCVGPRSVDSFVPTLVLLSSVEVPEDPLTWMTDSMELLVTSIPGFLVIDDQGWAFGPWVGSVRCGTYVMETTSVTVLQWCCVGTRTVVTLTATCATSAFGDLLPVFLESATTLVEV